MKKILLFGSLALAMALSGCGNDYHNTWPTGIGTYNLVSTADGTTTISEGRYLVSRTINNEGTSGFIVGGVELTPDVVTTFTTMEQPYVGDGNSNYAYFRDVKSATSSVDLRNANFLVTRYYYWLNANMIPGYATPEDYKYPEDIMVAQYQIGTTYSVKTFQPVTFFCGETTTTYPGGEPFKSEEMVYELRLNIEKNTADLTIHNAKFAPQAPPLSQVVIKDLSLDVTGGQILVSGNDIIPEVGSGNGLTPNRNYPFNKIEFVTTSSDLTQARITYTVATVFNGSFNGSYTVKIDQNL